MPWYNWPIVGREGRREDGAETRETEWERCPSSRETAVGFGEAVHCWTQKKRWSNCRSWPVKVICAGFVSGEDLFGRILLYLKLMRIIFFLCEINGIMMYLSL